MYVCLNKGDSLPWSLPNPSRNSCVASIAALAWWLTKSSVRARSVRSDLPFGQQHCPISSLRVLTSIAVSLVAKASKHITLARKET